MASTALTKKYTGISRSDLMRRDMAREYAPADLPPHADPPFNRDRRLPAPEPGPMILATPGGPLQE